MKNKLQHVKGYVRRKPEKKTKTEFQKAIDEQRKSFKKAMHG